REMFPKAKVAALQALQLDSTLPEAHTSLGFISLFYDWDWPAADREFRSALSLDSTYTPALLYHGWYNVAVGRIDAAVSDLERARAIDPLSLILNTRLGTMLFLARRYDAALTQLSRTLALDSSYDLAHAALARVYIQLRQCDRAQLELHRRTRMVALLRKLGPGVRCRGVRPPRRGDADARTIARHQAERPIREPGRGREHISGPR